MVARLRSLRRLEDFWKTRAVRCMPMIMVPTAAFDSSSNQKKKLESHVFLLFEKKKKMMTFWLMRSPSFIFISLGILSYNSLFCSVPWLFLLNNSFLCRKFSVCSLYSSENLKVAEIERNIITLLNWFLSWVKLCLFVLTLLPTGSVWLPCYLWWKSFSCSTRQNCKPYLDSFFSLVLD